MRILLVEDDPFFQKFYAFKLQESGFTVDVGKDGVEGLAKLHENVPDVMLLDLIMPNKDGFEVLEEIAKDVTLKKFPILVFSTLSQEQDIQRAKDLGAVGYVNKSFFDFENLHARIMSVIPQAA